MVFRARWPVDGANSVQPEQTEYTTWPSQIVDCDNFHVILSCPTGIDKITFYIYNAIASSSPDKIPQVQCNEGATPENTSNALAMH